MEAVRCSLSPAAVPQPLEELFFSLFKLAIWPRACLHGAAGAPAPCSSPRSLQAGGAAAVGSWSCGFPISLHPTVGQGQPHSTRAGGAACWGGRATGLGQNKEPGAGVSPWLCFWGAGAGFEPLLAEAFWCQALIFIDPTAVAPVPSCTAGQDPCQQEQQVRGCPVVMLSTRLLPARATGGCDA